MKPLEMESHYQQPIMGSRMLLSPPKNDLDLSLDMQTCLRLFSKICNYRAESRYLQQLQVIVRTHTHTDSHRHISLFSTK